MTIKDLYEKAKSNGMENAEIIITYACNDDYYSLFEEEIKNSNIRLHEKKKIIEIFFS